MLFFRQSLSSLTFSGQLMVDRNSSQQLKHSQLPVMMKVYRIKDIYICQRYYYLLQQIFNLFNTYYFKMLFIYSDLIMLLYYRVHSKFPLNYYLVIEISLGVVYSQKSNVNGLFLFMSPIMCPLSARDHQVSI